MSAETLSDLPSDVSQLTVSPRGRRAARLGGEGVEQWDLETGSLQEQALTAGAEANAVRWCGERLVVCGRDSGGPKVWLFGSGEPNPLDGTLVGAAFDGSRLALRGPDGSVVDEVGEMLLPAQNDLGEIALVRLSPEGRWLYAATTTPDSGGSFAADQLFELYSADAPTPRGSVASNNVALADFSPDGSWFARVGWSDADQDRQVQLVRPGDDREERRLPLSAEVTGVAFNRDSRWLAAASRFGSSAGAWDLDADHGPAIELPGGEAGVDLITFAGTDHTVVTVGAQHVRRLTLTTDTAEARIGPQEWQVRAETVLEGVTSWAVSDDRRALLVRTDAGAPRVLRLP